MTLSSSPHRSIWISLASRRAGSAIEVISRCILWVRRLNTTGRTARDSSEAMMNATGRTVVHVLFGPTRKMLRRSGFFKGRSALPAPLPGAILPALHCGSRRHLRNLR